MRVLRAAIASVTMNPITRIATAAALGLGLAALGTATACADTKDEPIRHGVVHGDVLLNLGVLLDLDLCTHVVAVVDADVDALADAAADAQVYVGP